MSRKLLHLESLRNMLNNERYSDLIFKVNKSSYHASRYIMAGASDVFEILVMSRNFQESKESVIPIKEVLYDESFYQILRYVYGHELDFGNIEEVVLWEMLRLAQMYNLPPLYNALREDLGTLHCFHIGNAVELMNAAKVFDIEPLYKRLQSFMFENSTYILEHESFFNINHEVLVDLLESSSFFGNEINILRKVLLWIEENGICEMYDSSSKKLLLTSLLRRVRFCHIPLTEYARLASELGDSCGGEILSQHADIIRHSAYGENAEPRVRIKGTRIERHRFRYDSGFTFMFTVTKRGNGWEDSYTSPEYEFKNLVWKLLVFPQQDSLLQCTPVTKHRYWECRAVYTNDELSHQNSLRFSYENDSHPLPHTYSVWRYIMEEEDNVFTVEVTIRTCEPIFCDTWKQYLEAKEKFNHF